jgi:peptidoglycan/LPS O-acetylase OafA/YrhL
MEVQKTSRNYNIDLLKFFCAFGVIMTHTQNSTHEADSLGGLFSPFRVPFFLVIALVFFISGLKKIELPDLAIKIWKRIITPYLAWTTIYVSLIIIKSRITQHDSLGEWWKILFFGASAVQLYFIPKILVMQGFALAFLLFFHPNHKPKSIGLIVFIISFVWLYVGINSNCLGFGQTDYQVIVMYLFIAFAILKLRDKKLFNNYYVIFGLILFILVIFLKFTLPDNYVVKNYIRVLGGLSFTLLAFALPEIYFSEKAGIVLGYSYGIYLCHILFLEGFEFVLKFLNIELFYNIAVKSMFSICILLASILFVFLVRKNVYLKKYLLGE